MRVLGVDGYQRGWVGVVWDGSTAAASVAPTIADLVLGAAGAAGVDDALDAAAACWSAIRIARGRARSFPDPPEPLDGLDVAIWA